MPTRQNDWVASLGMKLFKAYHAMKGERCVSRHGLCMYLIEKRAKLTATVLLYVEPFYVSCVCTRISNETSLFFNESYNVSCVFRTQRSSQSSVSFLVTPSRLFRRQASLVDIRYRSSNYFSFLLWTAMYVARHRCNASKGMAELSWCVDGMFVPRLLRSESFVGKKIPIRSKSRSSSPDIIGFSFLFYCVDLY